MATGGDQGQLTNKQIVDLAAAISLNKMVVIAEGYLDIDDATIKNKKYENKDDAEAFNREIIKEWRNKSLGNDVKVSYGFFFRAHKFQGSYKVLLKSTCAFFSSSLFFFLQK